MKGRIIPGPKIHKKIAQKNPLGHTTQMQEAPGPQIAAFFDPDSPYSMPNMLPKAQADALRNTLWKQPCCHEFIMDETELKKHLYNCHSYRPTVADNRIRYSFWTLYEETADNSGHQMDLRRVSQFIMTHNIFERMYLELHPSRTMWMMLRPSGYTDALQEMLMHGVTRMREILDMPITTPKGELNMKMLDLQVKITNMIDYRLHGAPKQDIRQLNVNVSKEIKGAGGDIKDLIQSGDMVAIQTRLNDLAREKRKLEGRVELVAPEPVVRQVSSQPTIDISMEEVEPVLEAIPVERSTRKKS